MVPNVRLFLLVPFSFSQTHKHEEINKAASLYSLQWEQMLAILLRLPIIATLSLY